MKSQTWGILTAIFVIITIWITFVVDNVYNDIELNVVMFCTFSVFTTICCLKAFAEFEE